MKHSTFYVHIMEAAKQQGISIDEALERVKAMGYEGVEMSYDQSWIPETTENMIAKAHEHGFVVANFFINADFAADFDEEYYEKCMKFVSESDTDLIQISPLLMGEYEDKEAAYKKLFEAQKKIVSIAQKYGVQVIIEDFDGLTSPLNCLEGVKYYLDNIPGLKYTFDTGNFYLMEEDCLTAFPYLKDKLAHVHMKDRKLEGPEDEFDKLTVSGKKMYGSAIGAGVIDTAACLREVKKTGYDGWIVTEHFASNDQMRDLEESIKFIDKIWNE